MSRLPQVNGIRLARALVRAGFIEIHGKGSHRMFVHEDDATRVAIIAMHKGKTIPPGTLRAILRGCRLTVEALKELL